jgi:hypothetical protein
VPEGYWGRGVVVAGRTRPYVSSEFGEFSRFVRSSFPGVFVAQGEHGRYVLDRLVCEQLQVFVWCREHPVSLPGQPGWRRECLSAVDAQTREGRALIVRCVSTSLKRQARVVFDPRRIEGRTRASAS